MLINIDWMLYAYRPRHECQSNSLTGLHCDVLSIVLGSSFSQGIVLGLEAIRRGYLEAEIDQPHTRESSLGESSE